MPRRVVRLGPHAAGPAPAADPHRLREGMAALAGELDLPDGFPPEVEEAARAAAAAPRLPDLDRTDLPFVTIDPPGSTDLDQALWIERAGEGHVVYYAIADVAVFVSPGDPVDQEAHRRGETLYGADARVPLHPPALSEDAASLLADQVRPAVLWQITLDGSGEPVAWSVERALVRSRGQYDYAEVQEIVDSGRGEEAAEGVFARLVEVGERRIAREVARGGVSLPLPDQEVEPAEDPADGWVLGFRRQRAVEEHNAQISLLTGMVAGRMMVEARVGLLRTLPPAADEDVRVLRRVAASLGIDWPAEEEYPWLVRSLDPARSDHVAMLLASTRVLRGSGYAAFDGELPELAVHAAIASAYAHCTAPLRRLVDRYTGEVCLALHAGRPVPDWVLDALPDLPARMGESGRRASAYERGMVDLIEALVLEGSVGRTFAGAVASRREDDPTKGVVVLKEPAVEAPLEADGVELPLGEDVTVRLVEADPEGRRVRFVLAKD